LSAQTGWYIADFVTYGSMIGVTWIFVSVLALTSRDFLEAILHKGQVNIIIKKKKKKRE
jgi:hypothetical protein